MKHPFPALRYLAAGLPALLLSGCISFSTSESPMPEHVNACHDKESQCREICGDKGVQAFSCTARPGEGVNLKCECRRTGLGT